MNLVAAPRLAAENFKHPICVIQAQGHVGLEARCAGVKAKVPGTEILYVNGADMTSVESTATAKLQASKDADVIIGLGAPITLTLIKSVSTAGSSAKVASFDLNKELAQKISDGSVLFTVDQQPWLQGYGAVDALWQNKRGASADVKRIALAHADDLRRRIEEMEAMKRTLERLAECCHGDHRPDCPILDELAED